MLGPDKKTSEFEQRTQILGQLKGQGYKFSPEEERNFLATGQPKTEKEQRDQYTVIQGVDNEGHPAMFRVDKNTGAVNKLQDIAPKDNPKATNDHVTKRASIESKAADDERKENERFDREWAWMHDESNASTNGKPSQQQSQEFAQRKQTALGLVKKAHDESIKALGPAPAAGAPPPPAQPAAAPARAPAPGPPPAAPNAAAKSPPVPNDGLIHPFRNKSTGQVDNWRVVQGMPVRVDAQGNPLPPVK
jgi:hypothetical protein